MKFPSYRPHDELTSLGAFVLPSCEPKLGKEEGRYHVSNKLGIQRASELGCCLLQALDKPTWVRAWVLSDN